MAFPDRRLNVSRRLLLSLALVFGGAGAIIGCGGSSMSLAIEGAAKSAESLNENPGDSSPKPDPNSPGGKALIDASPAADALTDDPTAAIGTAESTKAAEKTAAIDVEVSKDSEPSKMLQPKLSQVDPDRLVGTWKDSFFGTRILTLNADKTARMVLNLDLAGRLLYGSQLDFDLKWSLEGGTVTIEILDGRPARSAKSAMDTWGRRFAYLLDSVEEDKVEMRDWDGSMSYVLRRLPDPPESESAPKE